MPAKKKMCEKRDLRMDHISLASCVVKGRWDWIELDWTSWFSEALSSRKLRQIWFNVPKRSTSISRKHGYLYILSYDVTMYIVCILYTNLRTVFRDVHIAHFSSTFGLSHTTWRVRNGIDMQVFLFHVDSTGADPRFFSVVARHDWGGTKAMNQWTTVLLA